MPSKLPSKQPLLHLRAVTGRLLRSRLDVEDEANFEVQSTMFGDSRKVTFRFWWDCSPGVGDRVGNTAAPTIGAKTKKPGDREGGCLPITGLRVSQRLLGKLPVAQESMTQKMGKPSRSIQRCFVDEVDQIVWHYKLSPETINLPARPGVPEIQIFEVSLRTGGLSEVVLRTIDKAIPFPIFYEVSFGDRIKSAVAYKRPSDADSSKWGVDAYFEGPWHKATVSREPLPVALDLAGLYEQMLRRSIMVPARSGESLKAHVERINAIRTTEKECRKLETRLKEERQFNRKVELNHQLRDSGSQTQNGHPTWLRKYRDPKASWKS